MNQDIYFSIVIPTYNRVATLDRPLKSLEFQDFKNFEIIIVDDCSTDETETFIRAQNNPCIKYIRLEKNQGPNVAKNYGATISQGVWLVFLDSDDSLASSSSLTSMHDITMRTGADILFTSCIDQHGQRTSANSTYNDFLSFQGMVGGVAQGEYLPSIKKETFLAQKFFTDIVGGEGLTWQALVRNGKKLFVSSIVTRIYYTDGLDRLSIRSRNLMRLKKVTRKELGLFWKSYLKFNPKLLFGKILRYIYYGLAVKFPPRNKLSKDFG